MRSSELFLIMKVTIIKDSFLVQNYFIISNFECGLGQTSALTDSRPPSPIFPNFYT